MSKAPETHTVVHRDYNLERLVVLSDAVFAIAMTLLALELKPPEIWDGKVSSLFQAMRGALLAYGVSFAAVAGYWSSHRRSFRLFLKTDGPLTLLGLLSLGLVTLLPVVTRLLMQHGAARGALLIYLSLIAAIGVANALTWGYASLRGGVVDPRTPARFRLVHFAILLFAPLAFCVLSFLTATQAGPWLWVALAGVAAAIALARRWAGKEKGS